MGTDHILPQLLLLIFVPLLIEADQLLSRKIPWGIRSLINIVFSLTVQKKNGETKEEAAAAVSEYLPYGEYVIAEEQPYAPELLDFKNRHYEIDAPKEIFLPEAAGQSGDDQRENYIYKRANSPVSASSFSILTSA